MGEASMRNHVRGRVLLAEDDPCQRELLAELLEFEGYHVLSAGSPGEVVRMLEDERPDAVLLDVLGVAEPEVWRALQRGDRPRCVLVSGEPSLPQLARRYGA